MRSLAPGVKVEGGRPFSTAPGTDAVRRTPYEGDHTDDRDGPQERVAARAPYGREPVLGPRPRVGPGDADREVSAS